MSEFNPNQLSDEDLEKALNLGEEFVPPTQEPAGEFEVPVEDTVPEPEVAQPAEPEKVEEKPPVEVEEDVETQRVRLLTDELEARAKHWESVAGRNAGELGFIRNQLKALQDAQNRPRQEVEYQEQSDAPAPTQAPAPTRDGLAEWAVQQAVQQAVGAFENSHPDVKDLNDQMTEYIKGSGYNLANVMQMNNPIEAQREVARALEEAYWHSKAAVNATRRAELEAKREAIQVKAAANKLKASVSGTAATPPPKPKSKTVDEMTDAELEAEMVRSVGGRW